MKKDTPETICLRDYRPSAYAIDAIDLSLSIYDDYVTVISKLMVRVVAEEASDLVLDGVDLELISVSLENRVLDESEYRQSPESLIVFNVPASFVLQVETRIRPASNTSLEGLYLSNGIYCTQCESEGFRKITYYLDRPDVMATYTTTIEADKEKLPTLLANGNLVDSGELADGRHYATWQDPFKKPSYLFAMVAGDLFKVEDFYTTGSGRHITLQIYVEPHNRAKCGHAMRSLQEAMLWDEKVFGLEYDLDQYMILAVDDFNAGAMENKGLNIFNSKYILAEPATATDDDYEGIEAVVAHEYFHNWTGNRITCRDWFQLSLKEGLTVFRDQEFSADMTSRPVKRISDVRLLRNHQFLEDAGPMSHPVRPEAYIEINNFYTLTVYEKGSEVIRMFYTFLGPELFRKGMDVYIDRYDGQAVTIEDFASAMADAYNSVERTVNDSIDFKQFCLWYSQSGTPELEVSSHYDAAAKEYTLTVEQKPPVNAGKSHEMMNIPLAIGLLDEHGNDMPLYFENNQASGEQRTMVLQAKQEKDTFVFANVPCKPVPSLLRGFSAPVNLHYGYSDEELLFLLLHDSDPFNRWEAGQRFCRAQLLDIIASHQKGEPLQADANFKTIFEHLLAPGAITDKSFLSLMLTLPSEEYLAEFMEVIDVDAIHVARKFLRTNIAEAVKDILLETYHRNTDEKPYRYDPNLAGKRRLKNLCLAYLMQLDDPQIWQLAQKQFDNADNMSDEMAALVSIVHSEKIPGKETCLADFFVQWQNEPLVMDKWFALQATAPFANTLDRVIGLMEHPLFSMTNPNKVRALIGSFAGGNPICFHSVDGAGYRFLVDRVLELDPMNPHIAARLLGRLSRWRKYDEKRQCLMKNQLERVAGCESLSKGVYEVAEKCLAIM